MTKADDITIVGAGPSGLACAIVLAQAGRRVTVREWHSGIGHRFHDEFQGLENWSHTKDVLDEMHAAGVDTNFEFHPFDRGIASIWGTVDSGFEQEAIRLAVESIVGAGRIDLHLGRIPAWNHGYLI
jgi:flavin-dependent dehydrogenase